MASIGIAVRLLHRNAQAKSETRSLSEDLPLSISKRSSRLGYTTRSLGSHAQLQRVRPLLHCSYNKSTRTPYTS